MSYANLLRVNCSVIHVINEDVQEEWAQYWLLGYTASYHLPTKHCTTDPYSLGLTIQPIFSPPHCLLIRPIHYNIGLLKFGFHQYTLKYWLPVTLGDKFNCIYLFIYLFIYLSCCALFFKPEISCFDIFEMHEFLFPLCESHPVWWFWVKACLAFRNKKTLWVIILFKLGYGALLCRI